MPGLKIFALTVMLSIPLLGVLLVFGFIYHNQQKVLAASTNLLAISARNYQSAPRAVLQETKCNEETVSGILYSQETPSLTDDASVLGYQNNKFGLYIYSIDDHVGAAADLVNSNGGEWGYVLIPYNVRDYDKDKWRKIFKLLQEKKLTPIIQLWDVDLDDYKEETDQAVEFLDSLEWPVKNRFVSIYNEPNDSQFWKGRLDPEGYAQVLDYTIDRFNEQNDDYFLMNAAFNATAPTIPGYMDQVLYMSKMDAEVNGIFTKLDGWASHSYPQPSYRGLPTGTGRGSVRTYEWELQILRDLYGINKEFPVFITETGWAHAEGENYSSAYYSAQVAADYIVQAYENVWLPDPRVVAVTPFTIYYDPPYDHFAWISIDGKTVYPQYTAIQQLPKIAGKPPYLLRKDQTLLDCN